MQNILLQASTGLPGEFERSKFWDKAIVTNLKNNKMGFRVTVQIKLVAQCVVSSEGNPFQFTSICRHLK